MNVLISDVNTIESVCFDRLVSLTFTFYRATKELKLVGLPDDKKLLAIMKDLTYPTMTDSAFNILVNKYPSYFFRALVNKYQKGLSIFNEYFGTLTNDNNKVLVNINVSLAPDILRLLNSIALKSNLKDKVDTLDIAIQSFLVDNKWFINDNQDIIGIKETRNIVAKFSREIDNALATTISAVNSEHAILEFKYISYLIILNSLIKGLFKFTSPFYCNYQQKIDDLILGYNSPYQFDTSLEFVMLLLSKNEVPNLELVKQYDDMKCSRVTRSDNAYKLLSILCFRS